MDLIEYYPVYHVLGCKVCKIGLHPQHYAPHLYASHAGAAPELASLSSTRDFVNNVLVPSLDPRPLQPQTEVVTFPDPDTSALPALQVFKGLECNYCAFLGSDRHSLGRHFNKRHDIKPRGRGGPRPGARGKLKEQIDREHYGDHAPWSAAHYQRFFRGGRGSSVFRVQVATLPGQVSEGTPPGRARPQGWTVVANVLAELKLLEQGQQQSTSASHSTDRSQVSPWLERTQWPPYLRGAPLNVVAGFGRPACPIDEPVNFELGCAVDRLVEAAYSEVCEEKINFFGQKRITSFIPGREVFSNH